MKRETILSVLMVVLLLVSAIPIHAVGSSEGGTRNTQTRENAPQQASCEEYSGRVERIRCRLQNNEYSEPENTLPEACRNVRASETCRNFYTEIRPCYELESVEKTQCFKRVSGFSQSRISEEQQNRAQKTRNYVVALLYDLEERVENANKNGALTDDETTKLIDKIVEIKQSVLNGAEKQEVRLKMQELRSMWRSGLNE